MTKKKERHFTKKEIAQARADSDTSLIHSLAVKLLKREKMSIAETQAAASLVGQSRPEGSISKVDLASIPEAQDYIFITLFLAYYGDLEGQYGILKFSGEKRILSRLVGTEEKREDVIRLQEYYEAWNKLFLTKRHKDHLLNLIIGEVNNDLDVIIEPQSQGIITQDEYNYRRKGTVLRSKYLYLRIKSIFEDLQSEDVTFMFGGTEIKITSWSMVHILNRHYAAAAKFDDSGKSFHADENLKFFEDPEELKQILEKIGANAKSGRCNVDYIPFKSNGVVYVVRTKIFKGNKIPYVRLQTFYPVDEKIELQNILTDYIEVQIEADLFGYFKK